MSNLLSNSVRPFPSGLIILVLLVFLSACTVSLVPRYDPSIVDGLKEANIQTLTLFSSVAGGSPKDKFPDMSSRYDEVIGKFGALRLQAMARAVPPLGKKISGELSKVSILDTLCKQEGGDPGACVNSSPRILETIISTLAVMRNSHRDEELPSDQVELFQMTYEISIQQVLTVETALKRD